MEATITQSRFKFLGVCDDVNECECCGKTNLARTIAFEDMVTSEIRHFGTSCATNPAKGFDAETVAQIKTLKGFLATLAKEFWGDVWRYYKHIGGKMDYSNKVDGCPAILHPDLAIKAEKWAKEKHAERIKEFSEKIA